jgi:hypothetical protein
MDVPAGNALPDPYGGAEQAAYPWRGRISVHPAIGESGTPDKTGAAAAQAAAFFGSAAPGDFGLSGGEIDYAGPGEFSFRRFILHHAKLAAAAGGVDFFIIGSELRGLTTARSSASAFPAVTALIALAADVRSMLGVETTITYAADWSEYFGHQPQDGSGDVLFHLDPLWADANIDVVGVDWYPPLTDWRDGLTHLDRAIADSGHNLSYLESRIEAGEAYDFYYASDAERLSQTRTPISDGAHGEPWVFRAKDIRNFWGRAHHNRPGGVRAGGATAWTPQSKPIWLIELGCPAMDKGANAPNLFFDAKSSESALPPFSSGARDDLIQRRTLEAYLTHWDVDSASNPDSTVDDRPMVERMFAWCWDARPYAAFPARADVWSDGPNWRRGHWLNGRAGLSSLGDVVADLCRRAGVDDADVSALTGAVSGYVVDAPSTARATLEPLMAAYDFVAAERGGVLAFFHATAAEPIELAPSDLTEDSAGDAFAVRADGADAPVEARVRFLDAGRDYLIADASARRLDQAEGGVETIETPLVLEPENAEILAQRLLADRRAANENLRFALGPAHMALEPGDRLIPGGVDIYEISRIEDAETRRLSLRRVRSGGAMSFSLAETVASPSPVFAPMPAFAVLDLPQLPGAEEDERPLIAVYASPWAGAHDLYAGADALSLIRRCRLERPAIMGETLWALYPGPVDRWDDGNVVRVKLYTGALASVTQSALLNGANVFAIEGAAGEWEIVQARNAVLVGRANTNSAGFCAASSPARTRCARPIRWARASSNWICGSNGRRCRLGNGATTCCSWRRRQALHLAMRGLRSSL